MSSFNSTTKKILAIGAIVLGAGVFYQNYASQKLEQAQLALRKVEAAQSKADATKQNAERYVNLLGMMADSNIDRQEPFTLISEFSPREISEVDALLGALYQRDGYFFLERFYLTWKAANNHSANQLPRVALELDGRKVLLFSSDATGPGSVTAAIR